MKKLLIITLLLSSVFLYGQSVISNPYSGVSFNNQYKSNFHSHTDESDGSFTPKQVIDTFSFKGYSILEITDHDTNLPFPTTWPWTDYIDETPSFRDSTGSVEIGAYYSDINGNGEMYGIRGNELSRDDHILSLFNGLYYEASVGEDEALDSISDLDGLAIMAHPRWSGMTFRTPGWYDTLFNNHSVAVAIEVFNPYQTLGVGLWDSINILRDYNDLTWGISNSDFHNLDPFINYNVHYMSSITENNIRTNLTNGAFVFCYDTLGTDSNYSPTIDSIYIVGENITILSSDDDSIQWYNEDGDLILTNTVIDVGGYSTDYVRAVLYNDYGATYTQPFGIGADRTYYVATDGDDDTGDGSISNPWATLQKGVDEANPGDTVYMRGGTYNTTAPTELNPEAFPSAHGKSGKQDSIIHYWAYPGESPIIDCRTHCTDDPTLEYNSALSLHLVEHIFFKGIEIKNVYQCTSIFNAAVITTSSANLRFEDMVVHNIGQKAFWHSSGAWNEIDAIDSNPGDPDWPAPFLDDSTYFINCDAYDLCDTLSVYPPGSEIGFPGNNADGFKGHNYDGNYMLIENCRAWNYSDDGFDISGSGVREYVNDWAMASWKYAGFSAFEGNGFKTAGTWESIWPDAVWDKSERKLVKFRYCLALYCDVGFVNDVEGDISRPNGAIYYNNTTYGSNTGFWERLGAFTDTLPNIYRNNLTYDLESDVYGIPEHIFLWDDAYRESHNTWDIDYRPEGDVFWMTSDTFNVTNADFIETDSSNLVALFTANRDITTNNLPTFPVRLSPTSDLIDAGRDVLTSDSTGFSLNIHGLRPDIGAYEYNANDPDNPTYKYYGSGSKGVGLKNGAPGYIRK